MIAVGRELDVPAAAAWRASIDTTLWGAWGPSLRGATIDGGGSLIGPGATGRVHTSVGISLHFEITEWADGHRWAWRVAGVPATGHRVEPTRGTEERCRAAIDVPVWAPAYAPLCWVALGRMGRVAADLPRPHG